MSESQGLTPHGLTPHGLTPQQVFEVIQTERAYQDRGKTAWNHRGHASVEAELLLMEEYLSRARSAWANSSDTDQVLDVLRKVVGVGFRCFENHGCPKRE